ncbi:MAG TPA: ParB-like protein [Caulobacteraceae bacterium]|nr:ParB-like protein [Caulobacteraceae bacterium]
MNPREPVLKPVAVADLRPTQITVGFREVAARRKHFAQMKDKAGAYLGRHMIPTVLGPKQRHYLIDNHHLALALHQEGVENVLVSVVADLSALSKASFWRFLDNRAWCHAYDAQGERTTFTAIPASIDKLKDDPYRSLAGELRHAGGYAKDLTPFSEFLWADFLRGRIKPKSIAADFDAALARAVKLAKSKDAAYLPGWCGPDPID